MTKLSLDFIIPFLIDYERKPGFFFVLRCHGKSSSCHWIPICLENFVNSIAVKMDKKRAKFRNPPNSTHKVKKPIDLSQSLDNDLYDRLAKIIPLPFGKNDPFEEQKKIQFKDLLMELDPNLVKKLDAGVSEEKIAEIIENYERNRPIEVNIEPRIPERKIHEQEINWIAEYVKKMKKERIVWQTKLFKDNKEIHEKPLYQQTEELIDIAADHFAVWLKQMDDESNINREFVKQLFSIEIEADASKALYVEPKEVSVIPHEVAKLLKLPQMSIQNNVIKMTRKDRKHRDQKPQTVAFGRLLPLELRRNKFNEDLFDDLYKIYCPPDLQSLKIVFESILHLRSTRALVEHLKENPELPRAKYLVDHNMFDSPKTNLKAQKTLPPLWTHFY